MRTLVGEKSGNQVISNNVYVKIHSHPFPFDPSALMTPIVKFFVLIDEDDVE